MSFTHDPKYDGFVTDPTYTGLPRQVGEVTLSTGMTVDQTDGTNQNYRNWRYKSQARLYEKWIQLNDARNLESDMTALAGYKNGEYEFTDTWFGVYPKRRRPRRAYPDEILPNYFQP